MIFKRERADGTIIVSGEINSYKDFKTCLAGCSEKENHGGKEIISEFADKNGEKFSNDYLPKIEHDFKVQEEQKKADALKKWE